MTSAKRVVVVFPKFPWSASGGKSEGNSGPSSLTS